MLNFLKRVVFFLQSSNIEMEKSFIETIDEYNIFYCIFRKDEWYLLYKSNLFLNCLLAKQWRLFSCRTMSYMQVPLGQHSLDLT